jgi:hypothetical protein
MGLEKVCGALWVGEPKRLAHSYHASYCTRWVHEVRKFVKVNRPLSKIVWVNSSSPFTRSRCKE